MAKDRNKSYRKKRHGNSTKNEADTPNSVEDYLLKVKTSKKCYLAKQYLADYESNPKQWKFNVN